jgi:hypothetical protein
MRPKQQKKADHDDLFKARLDQIINMRHELVTLADKSGVPLPLSIVGGNRELRTISRTYAKWSYYPWRPML